MSVASLLPRFVAARKTMRALAERETWSREQLAEFQLQRLNDLWREIAVHVPYYRQLRIDNNLPDRFASMDEFEALVPQLDKQTVAARREEFISDIAGRGAWHATSGSTGTPLRVFRTHAGHRQMLCAKYRFYASWGVDIFDRAAWLWNMRDGEKSNVSQRLQDRLRNRLRLPASALNDNSLRDYLRRIEKFRPAAIYGYSRAVYMLALAARDHGFRCNSLKFVCLTGETASEAMKQTVESAMGVPAVMEYGSVDCGFLAGEAPDRTMRVRADMVHLETLARADGQHDIFVTVLGNHAFPLLRYRIGDVTSAPIEHPSVGMPILAHVAGRDDDCVVTAAGQVLHATSIDELFEHDPNVRGYRVHQDRRGALCARIVIANGAFDGSAIVGRLEDLMQGYPVSIQIVDRLPQLSSGKHRLVTSDLTKLNTNFLVQGVQDVVQC